MELMEHQKSAVERLGNGKILYGGVGAGKSLTALGYYMKNEAPRDILVITTAKKRDSLEWMGEAAKFGIGPRVGATVAGVMTIDSWNNIGNYVDLEDAFVIFDEQRLVGSGAWVKAFQKIAKKNRWIMLSATPGDTWLDYMPVFIANGLYRNSTQFKLEHVVYAPFSKYPKVVRYLGVEQLEKYRNMLLVEMPYMRHTTRDVQWVTVGHDEKMFQRAFKDRWNMYTEEPIRDISELFRVLRKIVNTSPSRLEKLRELMKTHPRIIVFYNFDYELEILRELADEVPVAEWNGHRKQQIPDTDRWVYLVQYIAGAEAWNCVTTDTMVFWSLTYSYRNFEQAQGRIDRLNTPFKTLSYFVFVSNSVIDKAISRALKSKRIFNENAFAKSIFEN